MSVRIVLQGLIAFCVLGASVQAYEFPYEPPKPMTLLPGLDDLYHPITTKNPDTQKFFDQGLTLVYAFNHDAAYWSFQQASKLDPEAAMPYWGMALALGANINMQISPDREKKAYEHIQKALSLSQAVTDSERAYIQALAKRYSDAPKPDLQQQGVDYNAAMKELMERYVDDPDASTLYSESALDLHPWNQWDSQGNPRPGTEDVVNVLETVLKREPDHIGANHYYIHAIEASKYPERALMSAQRLRTMLPASGHLLHMPSHIYLLTGDYHQAVLANEEAVKTDRAYIAQFGIGGIYPRHYLSHNLYFLSRAYGMEGNYEDALRVAKELEAFYKPYFDQFPDLEYYAPTPLFVYLRFHRWNEILQLPIPNPKMPTMTVLWHFGRGMAFASLGQVEDAEKEHSLFMEGVKKLPAEAAYGYNRANTVMRIADLTLQAKIAEARKNLEEAVKRYQEAVAVQDGLSYNEPPDWYYPVRESLGALLLRLGKPQEAEKVFRESLVRLPRNGRALFGLLEALKAQSQETNAYWVEQEFKKAWQYSTTPLTVENL